MDEIKKIIAKYSPEVVAPAMLEESNPILRDSMKGKLLANADFATLTKVYEDKGAGKLKEYLERFDPYAENLNMFVNLYDERAEAVVASKIKALFELKSKILEYLKDVPVETNDNKGTPDGENKAQEAEKPETSKGQIPKK
jgi:uncharacterized protein YozE (UPF0346 family)